MAQKSKFIQVILLCGLFLSFDLSLLAARQHKSPVDVDGQYQVGVRILKLTDASRDNRPLEVYVFYPAQVTKDGPRPFAPDAKAAPYPLIIYSHGYTGDVTESISIYINHLVSQGFVVAGVQHKDTDDVPLALINRPLDVLFLLNYLADLKDDPLVGIIDTDNVGVTGVSFGGYTSVAVSGAQVNPQHFTDWCATKPTGENFDACTLQSVWDKLLAYHKQFDKPATGSTWAAKTDKRIHAVLSIIPCFGQLYDEEGLSAVAIPALLIGGTSDTICPFDLDVAYYYKNLGTADHYLVTEDKYDHFGTFSRADVIQHYASAFFGLYLQGKTDYAEYLTPDSAKAFRDTTLEATLGKNG
jgi:predicted dienelactone hydrolase